ncbi:MAG: lipopolysaccharide transport periplasmic protein LptA [Campylobacteraceae bacterium]|nr:lipopolysaccharide transport periplasmic protein LptA [Campylobacteraceae bacterium]
MKFCVCSFLLFASFSSVLGSKLIIDAKSFESNEKKGLSIFKGNVKLVRDKDVLKSDKLEIYLEAKKKGEKARTPIKYIATGNVKFNIVTELKHYKGSGKKIVYSPQKNEYRITGNGKLKELNEDTSLSGEEIFINLISGEARLKGTDKKPVRLIINIKEKEKEENK